jgi:hypothetical protein
VGLQKEENILYRNLLAIMPAILLEMKMARGCRYYKNDKASAPLRGIIMHNKSSEKIKLPIPKKFIKIAKKISVHNYFSLLLLTN